MQIENSVALVTGANRGIGAQFVAHLLARGAAKVYAGARRPESLAAVVAAAGGRVVPVQMDIDDPASVNAAAAFASDVNLLINNAGVLAFGGPLDGDPSQIARDMETNYFGTLRSCRAFVPVLEATGGGAIVNVLTIIALAPMPGLGGYSASKAAAYSMTQALRAQLRDRNITVHGVFPAGVDTDMLAGVDAEKADPSDVVAAALDGLVAGTEDITTGSASDLAYAAWLANPKDLETMLAS
ncbi:MAG: SDR family oxidoreductase [Actinobacteria bacterium]|nr:SDR family oxidoreductase [Actinomycetota bacterium]MBI3686738.1 SDR family oxidoreductase [Actinomycetota bacterium]